jgi:hypothetical protein
MYASSNAWIAKELRNFSALLITNRINALVFLPVDLGGQVHSVVMFVCHARSKFASQQRGV